MIIAIKSTCKDCCSRKCRALLLRGQVCSSGQITSHLSSDGNMGGSTEEMLYAQVTQRCIKSHCPSLGFGEKNDVCFRDPFLRYLYLGQRSLCLKLEKWSLTPVPYLHRGKESRAPHSTPHGSMALVCVYMHTHICTKCNNKTSLSVFPLKWRSYGKGPFAFLSGTRKP